MYIKEVILDGFKSYATRTSVGPFDPHFNAITGLNGTGKSNILDAIIFALGLQSIKHVRAELMSELIFKGGSDDIKRATVTLILDNQDKEKGKSPKGFEKYEQIVVTRTFENGGVCKYYLNSVTTTKKVIADMFESIQINLSTPNFMIQQGKITKVVNMKPKELIQMIEETVGATVYQTKRDKAEKDMLDKHAQINEVESTLEETILPNLRRQRKANEDLESYSRAESALNRVQKKVAIKSYGISQDQLTHKQTELSQLNENEESCEREVKEVEKVIENKKKRQVQLRKEYSDQMKERIRSAEQEMSQFRKKVTLVEAKYETTQSNVCDAEKKVVVAKKAHQKELKQVQDFKDKASNRIEEFNKFNNEVQEAEKNLQEAKRKEEEVNSGMILGDDGVTVDLRGKVMQIQDKLGEIKPKLDHELRVLKSDETNLKAKQAELAKTPSDAQIEKQFQDANREVERLKSVLARNQIDPTQIPTLEKNLSDSNKRLSELSSVERTLCNKNIFLSFEYRDPYPNFDRSKVMGRLFEFFGVLNIEKYGVGLEVLCAGFLSVVVVDNPETSKALILHGNLRHRTNFMPLSAIRPAKRIVTQEELARKFGPGKAVPVLSLLVFDKKYTTLMHHYFGSLVIAEDLTMARAVSNQMGCKAVSLEGDMVDPGGIMQGGTRPNAGEYLKDCQQLRSVYLESRELKGSMAGLKAKLDHSRRESEVLKEYEQADRNLKNAIAVRDCTAYAALSADIAKLKETIAKRSEETKSLKVEVSSLEKEGNTLNAKLERNEELKAKAKKDVKVLVEKCVVKRDEAKKKYEAKQASFKELDLDLKAREDMLANYQADIVAAEKELEEAEAEKKVAHENLAKEQGRFAEKNVDYQKVVEENKKLDLEVNAIEQEITDLKDRINGIEVAKIKRDNDIKVLKDSIRFLKNKIENIVKEYDHIDFRHYDTLEKPTEDLKTLERELAGHQAKVNSLHEILDHDAASRLGETSRSYDSLESRMVTLRDNRDGLRESMAHLDIHKKAIVKEAYEIVNVEFNHMMTTLLPESEAKLVPVDEEDLSRGLNIHVCLGGVWKESLTELSGGQRSLVALALVLSLCMYRPAPFYVLDEVDAALDLSHTQNIGTLIKERFKGTQFTCVSLKDGMFSNANVVFQTSFQNSKSSVTRRALTGASSSNPAPLYSGPIGGDGRRGGRK